MAIWQGLALNQQTNEVDGYVDLGHLGREPIVASNALTFVVRSITTKWKQPIGFFLTQGSLGWRKLQDLLLEALAYCHEAGIVVTAVVCDQETSQTRLWREMGVTPDEPSIPHPSTGGKVYYLPDPVHLLKSLRNNFMNYNIQVLGTSLLHFIVCINCIYYASYYWILFKHLKMSPI